MKKILLSFVAFLMVFALVACGRNHVEEKPLADAEHTFVAHGNYQLIKEDGSYTDNGWNGKTAEQYELSALKATTIKAVTEVNKNLGDALAKKGVKYLYMIDVVLGANDAGWTTNCIKDGKVFVANGSYAIKAAACSYEEADQVYAEEQWIPDPHTAYAESLTPATLFMPVWQEASDDNGFSWSSNPVCIGGAGVYTFVVAQYNAVSAAGTPGYGLGLIKKSDITEGAQQYVEYVAPEVHTYSLIGSFGGYNWDTDVDLVAYDGFYSIDVELKANDEVKVRYDHDWAKSWGNADGSNVKITEDGTYTVKVVVDGEGNVTLTITIAAHIYSIIGSFGGYNWDHDLDLTESEGKYTAEVEFKANDEFKVRLDHDWTTSWGNADGSNVKITEDGTYVVTLAFDADGNGALTVVKK